MTCPRHQCPRGSRWQWSWTSRPARRPGNAPAAAPCGAHPARGHRAASTSHFGVGRGPVPGSAYGPSNSCWQSSSSATILPASTAGQGHLRDVDGEIRLVRQDDVLDVGGATAVHASCLQLESRHDTKRTRRVAAPAATTAATTANRPMLTPVRGRSDQVQAPGRRSADLPQHRRDLPAVVAGVIHDVLHHLPERRRPAAPASDL